MSTWAKYATAVSSILWLRRGYRPAQIAVHLRVRPLQVLIELFLLVIAQDLADLFTAL